jgi:hypothetical protein
MGENRCKWGQSGETWRKMTTWKTNARWKDNNKMNIKGIGWEYEDSDQLAPDMKKCWAPTNMVMSL